MADFATLEARINAVALGRCANATAAIGPAAVAVRGVFDAEYIDAIDVGAVRPAFVAETASLGPHAEGVSLTIDCASLGLVAAPYTIVDRRDEHGMLRLFLREGVA